MVGTFWLGVYPGLTTEMLDYVIQTVREFVAAPYRADDPDRRAVRT